MKDSRRHINICKKRNGALNIHYKSNLLIERVRVIQYVDKIILANADSIGNQKCYKPTFNNSGWLHIFFPFQIEAGKYLIDEDESNEDQIVFYLTDKL